MVDERKLAALRELLDPEVIAAWLDEVEAFRSTAGAVRPVSKQVDSTLKSVDTRILTVADVAQRLGVSRNSVYGMVRRNEIPHVRVGSQIRFGSQVVNDWIARGGMTAER